VRFGSDPSVLLIVLTLTNDRTGTTSEAKLLS
jgi:hypothetical protein